MTNLQEEKKLENPRNILALVACGNYLLSIGEVASAATTPYEVVARERNANQRGLTARILEDGMVVIGDELPEELTGSKVLYEYKYKLPVKYNIHINGVAKSTYKITTQDSRAYKLPVNEFFALTEEDKRSVLLKNTEPFGDAPNPLPKPSEGPESLITDFYRYDVKSSSLVSSGRKASSSAKTKDGGTALVEKMAKVEHVKKSRVQYSVVDKLEMTGTVVKILNVEDDLTRKYKNISNVEIIMADSDIGDGFFPLCFEDLEQADVSVYLSVKSFPLEKKMKVFLSGELDENYYGELVKIIMHYEFNGQTMQEIRRSTKKSDYCVIWDKSNYKVYEGKISV